MMSSVQAATALLRRGPRSSGPHPIAIVAIVLAVTLVITLVGAAVTQERASATATPVANAPLRMVVDNTHPMLITQVVMGHNIGFDTDFTRDDNQRGWNIQQAWAGVPDELKSSMVFVLHPGHNSFLTVANARKWVQDNLAEGQDLGIHMMVLWGETPTSSSDKFTWIESLYQNYSNFIGTDVSELTSVTGDIPQLLLLANEYGGYHVQGSLEEADVLANKLETQSYYTSVAQYSQNFIYTPKNFHDNFDATTGQAMGDWLSGVAGNWGPYFDGYAFYGCGVYGQAAANTNGSLGDRCSRSQPEATYAMTMLDEWQQGASVFQLENQLDIPSMDSLYTPLFYQSILPAMRYMLSHAGPTKAQVMANTKVAFSEAAGRVTSLKDTRSGRDAETTLYDISEMTPGVNQSQDLWYYTRANGRYYQIPRIPKLAPSSVTTALTSAGATVIDATYYNANLVPTTSRTSYFNGKYAQKSTGDAFVQNVGSSWLIYNPNVVDNTNVNAFVPLTGSSFTELDLTNLGSSSYAAVTQSSTNLDIQLNNYRDDKTQDLLKDGVKVQRDMEWIDDFAKYSYVPAAKDTALRTDTVTVTVPTRPTATISGYDAHYTYAENWNAATGVYTLTVNHNGVVNVGLSTSIADSGWSQVAASDPTIAYSGTWTGTATRATTTTTGSSASLTDDGTSFQWTAPAGAGGTADVYIDSVKYAADLAVPAAGGHLFEATGLTNEPHTIRIVNKTGTVGIDHLSYVPSQEQMLSNVELNDFTYATAAEDQDTVWGSTHWTIQGGQMKILPYVAPWFGEETVYNKSAQVQNVSYEANLTMGKGTPADLLVRANPTLKQSYMVRLDPTNSGAVGEVALYKDDNTLLAANTTINLAIGTSYDVKLTANGNVITAFINGTQAVTYTDTSSTARTAAGYTGVRVEPKNVGGTGDFVYLDNPSVTNLDTSAVVYTSSFGSWSAASTWESEGALVFGAADNRTSFSFPWQWAAATGTWAVAKSAVYTNGLSGVFTGVTDGSHDSIVSAGNTTWANYLYSSMLKITGGNSAGLTFRQQSDTAMYRAVINSSTNTVSVAKDVAGTWTTLGSVSATVASGKWHNLKVTAKDGIISVVYDGRQALTVHDSTYLTGKAGYFLPSGATASFDDARIAKLPATTTAAGPVVATVVPAQTGAVHITGTVPVTLSTLKDVAPALPSTITAINSDGSRSTVAVTWASIASSQYATSTTPFASGQTQGKFTVAGTLAGTTVTATAKVTVKPKLSAPLTTAYTYDPAHPGLPPITFTGVQYTAGNATWSRQLYVRWDQAITVTQASPTQTLTGTIEGDPLEKATATVTILPAGNLALNKPVVAYGVTSNTARGVTAMVDASTTTGWYTGGATDGAFSDGTSSSTQGSLCSWAYVDLGSDVTFSSYTIMFGENITTYGSMFNAPYQIQTLTAAQASAHTTAQRNSSVCTRLSGGNFGSIASGSSYVVTAANDIWTTVASGTGTITDDNHALAAPVTARYVRVFTNEPTTAHRYGTAIFDFQVLP